MTTIGATLTTVLPGEVQIDLPFKEDLTQQHGYVHAGVVASILDSACGYAALSLMDEDAEVLTVEYKINLLRPAKGQRMIASARVIRAGRSLTVCTGDLVAVTALEKSLAATMLATMISVR